MCLPDVLDVDKRSIFLTLSFSLAQKSLRWCSKGAHF